MVKRKMVEIDEKKCNGCGKCIPNCHEGALKIVNGKAKLVSEVYCDGLGNCLGHCPQGAITIVEKEVKEFDFKKTNENLRKLGREELKENPLKKPTPKKMPCGCPGSMVREVKGNLARDSGDQPSQLRQWPVQLRLVPPNAPYFKDADLIIIADCVGFANPNLHKELIKGKAIGVGCPKLDNLEEHKQKIQAIIETNELKSVSVAVMEVPCCQGLLMAVEGAVKDSGKNLKVRKIVVGIDGSRKI